MKQKPKPEEVKLIPLGAFEREAAILFRVPLAEVKKADAERPKRHAKRRKTKKP